MTVVQAVETVLCNVRNSGNGFPDDFVGALKVSKRPIKGTTAAYDVSCGPAHFLIACSPENLQEVTFARPQIVTSSFFSIPQLADGQKVPRDAMFYINGNLNGTLKAWKDFIDLVHSLEKKDGPTLMTAECEQKLSSKGRSASLPVKTSSTTAIVTAVMPKRTATAIVKSCIVRRSVNPAFIEDLAKINIIPGVEVNLDYNRKRIMEVLRNTRNTKREEFYSDVLAQLLGKDDGNLKHSFLPIFISFLKKVANKRRLGSVVATLDDILKGGLEDVTIEVENGRIDVLIVKPNDWAIIIENKICGETDQYRQIPRYVEYVKDRRRWNVNKYVVVYLKSYEEDAKPSGYGYVDADFKCVENALLPIAGYLPDDNDKMSLNNGFLSNCLKIPAAPDIELVIEKFSQMIEKLAESARNLSNAGKVQELMEKYSVDYGTLDSLRGKVTSNVLLLILSAEIAACREVAKMCPKVGCFTRGQLHDRPPNDCESFDRSKEKVMALFLRSFLDEQFLLVVDATPSDLTFNIRVGNTSISIDGCLRKIFGDKIKVARNKRYTLSKSYNNRSVKDMITSVKELLQLIDNKALAIENAIKEMDI